jgi:hypothetical protein
MFQTIDELVDEGDRRHGLELEGELDDSEHDHLYVF